MSRMLDLTDIFELIYDRFYDGSFSQVVGVLHRCKQFRFHVLAQLGDQMDPTCKEFGEQVFGNIAFVAKKLAVQFFDECFETQWSSIVHVALGNHKVDDAALVIGDDMELESIEPAQ